MIPTRTKGSPSTFLAPFRAPKENGRLDWPPVEEFPGFPIPSARDDALPNRAAASFRGHLRASRLVSHGRPRPRGNQCGPFTGNAPASGRLRRCACRLGRARVLASASEQKPQQKHRRCPTGNGTPHQMLCSRKAKRRTYRIRRRGQRRALFRTAPRARASPVRALAGLALGKLEASGQESEALYRRLTPEFDLYSHSKTITFQKSNLRI